MIYRTACVAAILLSAFAYSDLVLGGDFTKSVFGLKVPLLETGVAISFTLLALLVVAVMAYKGDEK